jgi:hypothetical protein
VFAALLKFAFRERVAQGRYSKTTLVLAGLSGLVTTTLGILLAFFPAQQITSLGLYEVWMIGGTLFFVGLAAFFFFVYGRRRREAPSRGEQVGTAASAVRTGEVRR